MTKTYRLTYESVEVMHALFDRSAATQGWRIASRVLREYVVFFGTKTEQLDLLAQDGKAIFTSFTEKIQDGKGVRFDFCTIVHPLIDLQRYSSSRWRLPYPFILKTSRSSMHRKACTSSSTSKTSKRSCFTQRRYEL